MKKTGLLLIAVLTLSQVNAQTSIFNNLLQKNVTKYGFVDYNSFNKDSLKLKQYISYLEKTSPDNSWSTNKKKLFG